MMLKCIYSAGFISIQKNCVKEEIRRQFPSIILFRQVSDIVKYYSVGIIVGVWR